MHLCFDCLLSEDPSWAKRYRLVWLAILLWGGSSFSLPVSPVAIAAQGSFFLAAFGWSVWPLFAARRPIPSNRPAPRGRQQDTSCN